jgi:hypothetical protein
MPTETTNKDKNPIPENLDVLQPDKLEPDPPDTPTWRAVKKGAKWGSIAGLVIAQIVISSGSIDTPIGPIYGGNMFAVFAIWIGLGIALGAAIGWASTQDIGSDDAGPPPT